MRPRDNEVERGLDKLVTVLEAIVEFNDLFRIIAG